MHAHTRTHTHTHKHLHRPKARRRSRKGETEKDGERRDPNLVMPSLRGISPACTLSPSSALTWMRRDWAVEVCTASTIWWNCERTPPILLHSVSLSSVLFRTSSRLSSFSIRIPPRTLRGISDALCFPSCHAPSRNVSLGSARQSTIGSKAIARWHLRTVLRERERERVCVCVCVSADPLLRSISGSCKGRSDRIRR